MKPITGLIIIIVLIAGIFVPIDVPYTIQSTAKALPAQQWVLHKNPDGALVSTLHDFQSGLIRDYSSFQFDRGDVVNITFNQNKRSEQYIALDETIADIQSNSLNERVITLENELAVERANLANIKTGEKSQIVDKRNEEIKLAKQTLTFAAAELKRAKDLFEEGSIAKMDLDKKQNAYDQADIQVKVAKRSLAVTSTGEKPEAVRAIQSRIVALEERISFMQSTQGKLQINSPLAGRLRFESDANGDKIIVEDTAALVLHIPIKLRDREFLHDSIQIKVKVVGNEYLLDVDEIEVSDKVLIMNMQQVVMLKALITKGKDKIAAGMPMRCELYCGDVSPKEYLERSVQVDFR